MVPQTTTFFIDELCCADEEHCIRKRLATMEGVNDLTFDLISRKLMVMHSCPQHDLATALHEVGFTVHQHLPSTERTFWENNNQLILTCIAGTFLFLGIILSSFDTAQRIVIPLLLCSMVVGGWRIAIKAFISLKQRSLDMNVLMMMAAIGALGINKYEEGAAVVVLFSVSHLLERYSIERTRKRISSLMKLTPVTATVIRNGKEQTAIVEVINIGERIMIRPGERIPLDGIVVEGESSVNQAPITGESRPVSKNVNDTVYAGTLNERGTLIMQTQRLYYDTTLARIIRKIEEAQTERAPIQTVTERFAKYYTPAVFATAVLTTIFLPPLLHQPFNTWFYRSLVLLVIACPCSLVISTPITIVSALTNAANHGVLIKGGRYLETIGKLDAMIFDKTGTLTKGAPLVTDIIPLNSLSADQVIQLAAAIESKSEHHLASAILNKASEQQLAADIITYQHFESLTGRGVTATINGITYFIGNHALIEEQHICSPKVEGLLHSLEREGKTVIIIGTSSEPLGIIAIADVVRSESKNVIRDLHAHDVKKIIMMTGDNEETARAIAAKTGIDEFYANLLPEEKMFRVQQLKQSYNTVAMVGDGINDAPALAASTIGIAMGTSGTDTVLETADIVLMSDDLTKLPYLLQLGKKTLAIIKQNIVIALATKLIFITLGIFGWVSLWVAVLVDDGATLVVIVNGLRALRLNSHHSQSSDVTMREY